MKVVKLMMLYLLIITKRRTSCFQRRRTKRRISPISTRRKNPKREVATEDLEAAEKFHKPSPKTKLKNKFLYRILKSNC